MTELMRQLAELKRRFDTFVAGLSLPPKGNQAATTAPGMGDDEADGYQAGSVWIDVSAGEAYICVDASAGAAVWKQIT